MKTFTLLLFLIAITFSCGKADDPGLPVDESSTFTCKINGNNYSVSGLGAYAVENTDKETVIYGIEGIDVIDNPIFVYLIIKNEMGPGTHDLSVFDDAVAYYTDKDNTFVQVTVYPDSEGEVIISERKADRVVGTFNFTVTNPDTNVKTTITNGKFNVNVRR